MAIFKETSWVGVHASSRVEPVSDGTIIECDPMWIFGPTEAAKTTVTVLSSDVVLVKGIQEDGDSVSGTIQREEINEHHLVKTIRSNSLIPHERTQKIKWRSD